jgi:hypothetical protein
MEPSIEALAAAPPRARRRRAGGINDAADMKAKHPALFALLPPMEELGGFNLTSVFTTEDFKLLLGIRRNLALRELASLLMERLGVQPSPGSQTYVACSRRPRGRERHLARQKQRASPPVSRCLRHRSGWSPGSPALSSCSSVSMSPSPRSVSTPRFRDRALDACSTVADNGEAGNEPREDTTDAVFVQMHTPLEDFERQGTRGMDSTHTRKALYIDPSTIGTRDLANATNTMRIIVGRCSANKLDSPHGQSGGPNQWTLTVKSDPTNSLETRSGTHWQAGSALGARDGGNGSFSGTATLKDSGAPLAARTIQQVEFSMQSTDPTLLLCKTPPFSFTTRTGETASNIGVKVWLGNGKTVELTHPLVLHKQEWDRTYEVHVDTGRVLPRLLSRNKRPIWSSAGPVVFPADSSSKRTRGSVESTGDSGHVHRASTKRPRTPNPAGHRMPGMRKAAAKELAAPKKLRSAPRHCMPIAELAASSMFG